MNEVKEFISLIGVSTEDIARFKSAWDKAKPTPLLIDDDYKLYFSYGGGERE